MSFPILPVLWTGLVLLKELRTLIACGRTRAMLISCGVLGSRSERECDEWIAVSQHKHLSLPHPFTTRRGRDGRGLAGRGYPTRPQSRAQAAACGFHSRRRAGLTLCAGSQSLVAIGRHGEGRRRGDSFLRVCGSPSLPVVKPYQATIARGRCSERLAGTEAYLPLLEALESLLPGGSNPAMARLMKQIAPTWYASSTGFGVPRSRRDANRSMFVASVLSRVYSSWVFGGSTRGVRISSMVRAPTQPV